MRLSNAIQKLKSNPMAWVADRCVALEREGKRIIHFEIGEPDFDTPKHVVDAAVESLRNGETHYGTTAGLPEFREAVAASTKAMLGFKPSTTQIIAAPGLSLIYFLLRTIAEPGDEIILPDPGFSPYYSILEFMDLVPVTVPLKEENDFRMDPKDVLKRITEKTKMVLVNSPQNPTGAVMTKTDMDALARIAEEHNVYILSDEVYNSIIYESNFYSPGVSDTCLTRTIILNSFSKAYAMTGWRIGYMIAPEAVIEKMSLLIGNTIYSVPTFIQRAGLSALRGPQDSQRAMVAEYRKRRDLFVSGLNALPGIRCLVPLGAFYVFPNIEGTGMNSREFVELMLDEAGVAFISGSDFGNAGEGYVRGAYCVSLEDIEEGLSRMRSVLYKRG